MLFDYWKKDNWVSFHHQGQTSFDTKLVWQDEGLRPSGLPFDKKMFAGDYLETYFSQIGDKTTLYVGLGLKAEFLPWYVKEVLAKVAKTMKTKDWFEYSVDISPLLDLLGEKALHNSVVGLYLGTYSFILDHKEKPADSQWTIENPQVCLYAPNMTQTNINDLQEAVGAASNVARGLIFARDRTNMPGNLLRPQEFAQEIIQLVEGTGITYELMDVKTLEELQMNTLLAVGKGSASPTCFLVLHYDGEALYGKTKSEDERHIGLVGKSITYDSGGYSLKPSDSMLDMNGDMGGGAAVAGAIYALAANRVKARVSAFFPICENRIGPDSLSPSDVIRSFSGKTIEVLNTDAEGRLILCDAISYAVRNGKVTHVVDIATLTGSVVGALGHSITGVVSNNDDFWAELTAASAISEENYWRFPSSREYDNMIKSEIADIKNIGEKYCGTITAGLFLKAFVEDKPWIHLDIAGTGSVNKPLFEYQSKGATGAGVETLYYLCAGEGEI